MTQRKKGHSKQRKKFQEMYIDLVTHSMSVTDLIEAYKAHSRTGLNPLSEKELVQLIQNPLNDWGNLHHIHQWDKYLEFLEYINKK